MNLKLELGIPNQLASLKNLYQAKKKENLLFCIYDPLGVKLLTTSI